MKGILIVATVLAVVLIQNSASAQTDYDNTIMVLEGRPDRADFFGAGFLTLDANSDGYDDFAVSAWGRKTVSIFYGGPGILDDQEDEVLRGDGKMVSGDFNGDGVMDFVVQMTGYVLDSLTGEYISEPNPDSIYAYIGAINSNHPYSDGPTVRIGVGTFRPAENFGKWMEVGDVNGDGISDLVTSAPKYQDSSAAECSLGAVFIYLGDEGNPLHRRITIVPQNCDLIMGHSVECDDVNGDGLADIIIGVHKRYDMTPGSYKPVKEVVYGKYDLKEENISRDQTIYEEDHYNELHGILRVAPVADIDRDGFGDMLVPVENDIDVWHGSDSGLSPHHRSVVHNPDPTKLGVYAGQVYDMGDWNADGYSDYGLTFNNGLARYVLIYAGGMAGLKDTVLAWTTGYITKGEYGSSLAHGDYNGDGIEDFIVGRRRTYYWKDHRSQMGIAYIYSGSSEFTVGVRDIYEVPQAFQVYPNPTTDAVHLRRNRTITSAEIQLSLVSVDGRNKVFSESFDGGIDNIELSLAQLGLRNGVYILLIMQGDSMEFYKIVFLK